MLLMVLGIDYRHFSMFLASAATLTYICLGSFHTGFGSRRLGSIWLKLVCRSLAEKCHAKFF